jgi:SEC-C motif-containing protein
MTERCACDSGEPFAVCCEPILDGAPAPTAVALMRSRYTAFVKQAFDYLVATHDPDTRGALDAAELQRATRQTMWLGLEIVTTKLGSERDKTGIVEFIASGSSRGRRFAQRERSRFRRIDGRWVYVDGDTT